MMVDTVMFAYASTLPLAAFGLQRCYNIGSGPIELRQVHMALANWIKASMSISSLCGLVKSTNFTALESYPSYRLASLSQWQALEAWPFDCNHGEN